MRTTISAGLLGLTLLQACAGPSGQDLSASEYNEMERRTAARMPGRATAKEAEEERREIEKRSRKLDQRRADHAHAIANLVGKESVLEVEQTMALADENVALAKAQRELRVTTEDLTHFQVVEMDRRLRASDLDLQSSNDRLLETREELAQLELMYGASELGDATAEIVVERTRRRLLLAEMRHKMREQAAGELRRRTLPRELEVLETALVEKTVAMQNTKRRLEKQALERDKARRDLEHDLAKSERETAAIAEDDRLLAVDRKAWNRERDDDRRGGTP
jgi:hypothetical protein